jgi:hypothetical protein
LGEGFEGLLHGGGGVGCFCVCVFSR